MGKSTVSLTDPESLPYLPGESPYRVKGVFYRGNLDYIERVVPGGTRAVLERFRSEKLRSFFEQPFVAASFYDVFPLMAITYPSAALTGQTPDRFLAQRSRFQAENQSNGVYRSLLSLSSPSAIAIKLPLLASQLYDFGATEARAVGERTVEVVRSGMPSALLPWYVPGTETYVVTALTLSGAKNARAVTSPFRFERRADAVLLGTVTHTFSWEVAAS